MPGPSVKARLPIALLAAALLACAVSACGISIAEDGAHEVRSRTVAAFDRVEVHGSTQVTVEPGNRRVLRIEGGANRIDDLTTRVEGRTLVVEREDTSGTIDLGGDPARVVARAPRIEVVRIDGSGKVILRRLDNPRLGASIHGSGEVEADGQVQRLRSRVEGSGDLRLASLDSEDAAVTVSGSGSAALGDTERLDAEIDGSGSVSYAGDPMVNERVSGSGRVQRR